MIYYLILSIEMFGGTLYNEHLYTFKSQQDCYAAADQVEPVTDKWVWDNRIAKDTTAVCIGKKKTDKPPTFNEVRLEVIRKLAA